MNGSYLCEFLARLTMNLPFAIFLLINMLLKLETDIAQLTSFLCEFLTCLTVIESCWINILYLILFVDKGLSSY
jgi:hypothetical protein